MITTYVKLAITGALLLGMFAFGWFTRDAFCDAAEARAQLAAERLAHEATKSDLAAANLSVAIGNAAMESIEQAADARQQKIAELEKALVKKPLGTACRRLDADGLHRLLDVSPR